MDNNNIASSRRRIVIILVVIGVLLLLLLAFVMERVLGTTSSDVERSTERITAATTSATMEAEPSDAAGKNAGQETTVQQTVQTTAPATEAPAEGGVISADEAKAIALKDARVKESEVYISKLKYEWDDGIQVYDVEFYQGYTEYEYEINAVTGAIIEKDMDYDD